MRTIRPMAVSATPAPLQPASASTPSARSLLVAIGALVAVVALIWGIGSVASDGTTTIDATGAANATGNATANNLAATTPTTFDRLNTPVGHHGEYQVQYADLPARTQAQLDVVRKIIERYPTAAVAEADGWTRATTNLTGIAAHFLRGGVRSFLGIDGTFDVNNPEILLFDGEGPDAPIVGISYLVNGPDPAGFYGKWDVWHRHQAVCFAGGYVIGEIGGHAGSRINMTTDTCKAAGGLSFPIANLTMLHVWMKPGFASSTGVFSHDHPQLN
jgi:hypothetical protein